MFDATPADYAVFVWFLACWIGYTGYADGAWGPVKSLVTLQHALRRRWMTNMVGREARMSDVQIVSTLIRSCSLFSSMSILVLAGIFTVLGSLEKARGLMGEWAFAVDASRALRQYRLGLLMTGAAPNPEDTDATLRAAYGERAAQVISRGVGTFNRGIRPYYFGLAALCWFVQPWLLAVACLVVVGVLYRRFLNPLPRDLCLQHA